MLIIQQILRCCHVVMMSDDLLVWKCTKLEYAARVLQNINEIYLHIFSAISPVVGFRGSQR